MIDRICVLFLFPALALAPPPVSYPTSSWGEEVRWQWSVSEYPNPQKVPRSCNRFSPSRICDPDRILTVEEADILEDLINNIQSKTMCICENCNENSGMKFGVAIMEKMQLGYNERLYDTVKRITADIRRDWSMGECDDDVLILMSVSDKQVSVFTDTGEAARRMLPEAAMDKIFLDNKAEFSSKNYYLGLHNMLDDYYSLLLRLQHEPLRNAPSVETAKTPVGLIVGTVVGALILIGLLIAAVQIYQRRNNRDSTDIKSKKHSLFNFRKEQPPRPFFIGNPSPAVYQPCQKSNTHEDEGKNTEDEDIEEVSPKTLLTEEADEAVEEQGPNVDSATLPLEPHVEIKMADDVKDADSITVDT